MQYGGSRLGGVPLSPGGTVAQVFEAMRPMPVDSIFVDISVSLVDNAGGGFALVVSTGEDAAAEGVDDADILLDALFNAFALYTDHETFQGRFKPSEWRTILGGLNVRDLDGSMVDGAAVPANGGNPTRFHVIFQFPYSLKHYFQDGDIYHQGSRRLKMGKLEIDSKDDLTPTVTLANGDADVSAVSFQVYPMSGAGSESDMGPSWQGVAIDNLSTNHPLDEALRLLVMDRDPAGSNTAEAINVGDYSLWAPSTFQAKFQAEQLTIGGFDITARATPYIWIDQRRRFMDFLAAVGKSPTIQIVSGKSSLALYDVKSTPIPAGVSHRVSIDIGGGGALTVVNVSPPSLPAGTPIPEALAHITPQRILPGSVGGASPAVAHAANPADAAQHIEGKKAKASRLHAAMARFKR